MGGGGTAPWGVMRACRGESWWGGGYGPGELSDDLRGIQVQSKKVYTRVEEKKYPL